MYSMTVDDHNFHSMIMVFMDNIFHTYFVHDPYLVKDYHMFIIRLTLLLLHDDDGSKTRQDGMSIG